MLDPDDPLAKQVGRIAMRESEDGVWWHGYYALPDTMEGAFLLGSIRRAIVEDEARRVAFMNLMKEAVADFLEERAGARPTIWNQPVAGPPGENRAARRRREAAERRRDRDMN